MMHAHILRVFTNPRGDHGDLASVIIDEGRHIPDSKRQVMARELNTGETAFINNLADAQISIVHPQGEIAFAGVAAIATAWLINKLQDKPINLMHGRDGDIEVRQEGDLTWVRASLATMPPWHHKKLDTPEDVEGIRLKDTADWQHTMVWAWADEAKGLIRARTFAADWDIPEAEGNGSGSMMLAAMLNREIEVKHGKGSVVFAKPLASDQVCVGGRVVEDTYEVS